MSAETLRRAAALMRDEDPGCPTTHGCPWHGDVALAVARLLGRDADLMEQTAFADIDWERSNSMIVARAYLGESE